MHTLTRQPPPDTLPEPFAGAVTLRGDETVNRYYFRDPTVAEDHALRHDSPWPIFETTEGRIWAVDYPH